MKTETSPGGPVERIVGLHTQQTVGVEYLEVSAGVRYWEDSTVNGAEDAEGTLVPLRQGDCWAPVIRLADGVILDWPAGTVARIHYKVCDHGEYWLLDSERQRVAKWGSYYVPDDLLCPGDNGYGDYIILNVDEGGKIAKWHAPELDADEWKAVQPNAGNEPRR